MTTLLGVFAAVLNSLWQAAIVAALIWLALKLMTRVNVPFNAATRYVIWWAALAVVLVLPAGPRMMDWWHARTQTSLSATTRPEAAPVSTAPLLTDPPVIVTLKQDRAALWPLWIVALWAILCLYRLSQIGRSYLYLSGVKRRAAISPQPLPAIARPAQLLISTEIASPMAVGFLRPAVVLPESLPEQITRQELDHVLLHETAHIARRDDWTNLLARLLGAALALHPVAVWILRQIDRERETACDDWVVARTGAARPYAASLARMFELRSARRGETQGEALASGIFGGGSRLGERIEMLLKRGREFSPRASMARVGGSTLVLLALVAADSLAPRWIAFAQQLAFEVASVRSHPLGAGTGRIFRMNLNSSPALRGISGNHFTDEMATLTDLVLDAYNVRPYQISGGPGWAMPGGDLYDVQAKTEGEGAPTSDQVRLMLQSLLADRFKLKLHRELKELPVYELVIGNNTPKLIPDAKELPSRLSSMELLIGIISNFLDRPLLDKTGLKGNFQYKWDQQELLEELRQGPKPTPSIFGAVQEQLGLKLQAAKSSVEILIIDHAEKPDAN